MTAGQRPDPAPVSNTGAPPAKPPAAPVNAPMETDRPKAAPVGDWDTRSAHGLELTKLILGILAGSVIALVLYLGIMDVRESGHVARMYEQVLAFSQPAPLREADLAPLRESLAGIGTPPVTAPAAETVARIAHTLDAVLAKLPMGSAAADALGACRGRFVPQPGMRPLQITAADMETCGKALEQAANPGTASMDIDRLRLLRDLMKDANDGHQALRTFWISAAQLILVNVLLPLLTAMLGYIFGRAASGKGG